MCLYPSYIRNPRYKPNKKNGGKIPPVNDNRTCLIPIPCGRCIECKRKKAREWHVRLLEEIKYTKGGVFVTLTFSDQSIAELAKELNVKGYALDNGIAKLAVRRFMERWRKTKTISLRHWLITELGHNGTNNIHLHGILWLKTRGDMKIIREHWKYGHVWLGKEIYGKGGIVDYKNFVNAQTIAYMVKYVTKMDEKYKEYKPKILASPGIGGQYTKSFEAKRNKFKEHETDTSYRTTTGHKIALPTYYKNKMYTDEEKEAIWLHMQDEQKKYVMGKKIDTSDNLEEYHDNLISARKKNERLGYGTNKLNYKEKEEEEKLRQEFQNKRILRGRTPPYPPS